MVPGVSFRPGPTEIPGFFSLRALATTIIDPERAQQDRVIALRERIAHLDLAAVTTTC